ncbi:predicted protein [Chaetoceros tenuissimus]|uniref:Uncharacterized protein n=1 Tax=Chaetoceros tenuissimus TaxID=426638 RepID=A0AAD3CEK0_9STRA|nr:predicted protein [Chaetoceros tenuissimus]
MFVLTDDPEDTFFSSASVSDNKDNLSAVVVDKANIGMFIEIRHELDEFLYADKVAYNFNFKDSDRYVSIAFAREAGIISG